MKIIGIIGSRTRNSGEDLKLLIEKFSQIYEEGDWICSGGCLTGGDAFAEDIARGMGIPILIFPADWKKYGKRAGFIRNGDIAQKSNILISLKNKEGDGGAEDTARKFVQFNNGSRINLYEI